MVFETIFSRFKSNWKPRHTFSESGSPIIDDYLAESSRFGDVKLTKIGTTNLYERIQSFAESCDMALLISRYMQGDATALNRVQALYGDFSDAPQSYTDAVALFERVAADFSTLPIDIKEKFDNDASKFMDSLGSPEFFEKMAMSSTVQQPVEQSNNLEVTANE